MILSQAILKFQNKENFLNTKSSKEEKTKQSIKKSNQNKTKTTTKGVHISQSRNKIVIILFYSNTETHNMVIHAFRGCEVLITDLKICPSVHQGQGNN